jgi:hypothetical protein
MLKRSGLAAAACMPHRPALIQILPVADGTMLDFMPFYARCFG